MKISVNLDKNCAQANVESVRLLLITLAAPEASASKRLPLNLSLVLDRSGSMHGSKLNKAIEAATFAVRNLGSSDRVSTVAYDDEVTIVGASNHAKPETVRALTAAIASIRSGGSTNLAGGWLEGAEQVVTHAGEADFVNRVILLSDGLANVGVTDTDELARRAAGLRERGTGTTTIGIGADFNEDLLEAMAISGGGHFYFVEHAAQIPDIIHRELGELLATSARDVTLEAEETTGAQVRLMNSFENSRSGGRTTVRAGNLFAGESISMLFEVKIPSEAANIPARLQLRCGYTATDGGRTVVQLPELIIDRVTSEKVNSQEPNGDVLEAYALMKAAEAREEALLRDACYAYSESASALQQAASTLRTMAPSSPAALAEADALEQESIAASKGFSAVTRKALHFERSNRKQGRNR